MQRTGAKERGGSPIVTLLVLAALAYGVFVAIQYVPQWVEAKAVDSILERVREEQASQPVDDVEAARAKVVRMLQINELNDLTGNFTVRRSGGSMVITFDYERELNLLFQNRTIHYGQSVQL